MFICRVPTSCREFLGTGSGEHDHADGAEPEHLDSRPQAKKHDEVDPFGCPGVDDGSEPVGDAEVGHGKQHGWDAPFEPFPCANKVADDIAGRVMTQDIMDGNAYGYKQEDHGIFPLFTHEY